MTEISNINIGVINPYALAEVVTKKKINWAKVANPRQLLEKTLGMPYEKLFDPKYGSPLYAGLKYEPETKSVKRPDDLSTAISAPKELVESAGTITWVDTGGEFFECATEFSDPVQGAVGDCYFIAALSSIAWARPYVIAERTCATGLNQKNFLDMIEFYNNGNTAKVEITQLLPMVSNMFIYARSSEVGELWPALYEKAFAKWATKDTTDTPDILKIAGGDPVGALSRLTSLAPNYRSNSSLSAHDIWQTVRGNCISCKTFNPMVAWTYGTSPSPDVDYSSAHIAANHAYSIFGWAYNNNQEYIILRNPWGCYDATLNVANITWVAWDQPYYNSGHGWWRPIPMAPNDGVFALRSDIFQKYFAGFGWVKTPESP